MYNKMTNGCDAIVIAITVLAISFVSGHADEPTSTIDGFQYAEYNDGNDEIDLGTDETPTPDCPDDASDGDPDYFWDFGSLDGTDSGDGNAVIASDIAGSYGVTVSCEQDFTDSDGNDYTEDTNPSDPCNCAIQYPASLKFISGTGGASGAIYSFEVLDQESPPVPISFEPITVKENVDPYDFEMLGHDGYEFTQNLTGVTGGTAFSGGTDSSGGFTDLVVASPTSIGTFAGTHGGSMTGFAYGHHKTYTTVTDGSGTAYDLSTIQTQAWEVSCSYASPTSNPVINYYNVSPSSP